MATRIGVDPWDWNQVLLKRNQRRLDRKMTKLALLFFVFGLATGVALAAAWLPSTESKVAQRPTVIPNIVQDQDAWMNQMDLDK